MKKTFYLIGSIIIISLNSIFCFGQDDKMNSERSSYTQKSDILPLHKLQIETGFLYESDEPGDIKITNTSYNNTVVRYGLFETTEIKIGFDYSKFEQTGGNLGDSSLTGFNPILLGAKVKVTDENGLLPEIAVLGQIYIPKTGKEEFKPDYMAHTLLLAFNHTLTEKINFGYHLGAGWDGERPNALGMYAAILNYNIIEKLNAFVEIYGSKPQKEDPFNQLGFGANFLILENLLFDISGGIGLNDLATDTYISAGLSLRIPNK